METQDLSKLKIGSDLREPLQAGGRKRRVYWLAVVCLTTAVGLSYLGITGRLSPPLEVPTVKASLTFPARALTELNASGYVVAQRKAAVSSKATGRLKKLYVEEGKAVKAGEILAQLENDDLKATLEEAQAHVRVSHALLKNAEAELADAESSYNRQKALRESGAVSEQAFDTAEARYKKALAGETQARFGVGKAEASLRVAEINLEYSLIRAPFDGVILTKNADEGEIVAPFGASANAKAAVATMADMVSLMVEVDVSESSLEKVKLGNAVEIKLDALPNDRFRGTVHMIVPTADRSKATVLTKIKFDDLDPRVLPEMSAKAAFLARRLEDSEQKPFLGIPYSAVREAEGRQVVFRVNDARAHKVTVQTGRKLGDSVEMLSGVNEGDVIVLRPDKNLRDGRRVKVSE